MTKPEPETEGVWGCKACGGQDGVTNGECDRCGPVQTVPIDKDAQIRAGVFVEPEEPETD